MTLKELRRARAKLAVEINERRKSLTLKLEDLPDGEDLPAEDMDGLAALQAQLDAQDARIARLETLVADDGDAASPVDPDEDPDDGDAGKSARRMTPHGYGEKRRPDGKGFKAARFIIGQVRAKELMGFDKAAAEMERVYGDKEVAKALNTAGNATGGALIPQAFSAELIELLRAVAVVRDCDPWVVDLSGGNLTIPRLTSSATASYQGELDNIQSSQQSFDDVQLNAKKLTGLVPVSNDLIRRAAINVEAVVRDDLVRVVGLREDLAFLLGDGSFGAPVGLANLCAASNKLIVLPFAATDNGTILTAVVGTLLGMKLALKNNFSRMIRPRWIMSATAEMFLMGLRDQVGSFIYRDEMLAGTLLGEVFKTTQQLPTNLNTQNNSVPPAGAPVNNGSYIFLADFADVIIGDTLRLTTAISDQASYLDTAGNLVSAFTKDQTLIRVIDEHDFNCRHQASIAVALVPGWVPAGYTGFGPGATFYVQPPSNDQSAAASTWGVAAPTGSNNPANIAAAVPGGTLPGRP